MYRFFNFFAGFLGGEGPVDFGSGLIAVGLPSQGFLFELLGADNAAVKALAGKGGKIGFDHGTCLVLAGSAFFSNYLHC